MVRFGDPPRRGELDKLPTAPRWSAAALQHLWQEATFPVDCAYTGQEVSATLRCIASRTDDSSSPTNHASSRRRPLSPTTTSSRQCPASPRIAFSRLSVMPLYHDSTTNNTPPPCDPHPLSFTESVAVDGATGRGGDNRSIQFVQAM
jgi:hypothetical protein